MPVRGVRTIHRRSFLQLGAGSLGAAALAGASEGRGLPAAAATKPKVGGQISIGIDAEGDGLSPISSQFTTAALYYGRAIFDPIAIVAADGSVKPYLCQSITPNSAYTAWTFKLRPGITFHDGTPLDSAALANHFHAMLHSAFAATSAFSTVTQVATLDPLTVQLRLSAPWVALPTWLTGAIGTQLGLVAAPSMLANPAGAQHPVGTGPFVFVSWEPGSHLVVKRNPHYWQPGLPYVEQITFLPIVDDTSRYQSLQSGTVDVIQMSDPLVLGEMLANPQLDVLDNLVAPPIEPSQNCIILNTQQPPLDDVRVRRALAYATDQKKVIAVTGGGLGVPSTGLFSPGTKYYAPTGYPQYDLAKAKALVAQYQAAHGGSVPGFPMQVAGTTYVDLAQQLQQMWKRAGINLSSIVTLEQTTYNANLVSGNYHCGAQQQFEAADPDENYAYWSTADLGAPGQASINFSRFSNATIQAALEEGRSNPDPAARIKAYQTISDQFAQYVPYLWITRQKWGIGSTKRLGGIDKIPIPSGGLALPLMQGDIWMQHIYLT